MALKLDRGIDCYATNFRNFLSTHILLLVRRNRQQFVAAFQRTMGFVAIYDRNALGESIRPLSDTCLFPPFNEVVTMIFHKVPGCGSPAQIRENGC